ncbi:AAA family ATPase [Algoriphagus sp. C2-6-M1]|uniref:AAA family ATPase n=1 Tax=Algoriphagus persicinus TaxID=3108754 RepID=UPI002B3E9231|nr:AAA family ATPase [Algoriphagus sp. C2-6-M1]MEB2782891.1 AAA family ATPase [Algoriphagus sp. C2-6-M1]
MIIGTILRNFKTYNGINYVPISHGPNFCGLVGNNGIGKSSVLEALDSFFNGKTWNYNIVTRKSGFTTTRPHIVPIFLIEKTSINQENIDVAELLSGYTWEVEESDILSQNRDQFKTFSIQREILKRDFDSDKYFLLPLGNAYDNVPSLSFFNTKKLGELVITDFDKTLQQIPDEDLSVYQSLLGELKVLFEFIYIPKDIDPENFTQLETREIQSLMGETLNEIVEKCVPQNKIQEINFSLNKFIDSVSDILEEYAFRTGGERQVNLRKHDVYKLIVEAYFKIRKLHKKEGAHWLEMSSLSSGEKQKAIIELAYHFLKSYRTDTQHIILGIDEPESSLHMSACYDQFNKLFEVSLLCKQLIFTTHWYGFIPTVEDGCVSVISKNEKEHIFDLVDICSYRETVKQSIKTSKGKLPYDIRLKSINDFTQSVVTSILTDEPYNWLICEGSSEKIYFESYFADIKKEKKLRIIPVGGATEIKRIYNNLQVAYEDFKKEIQGKVVLISDTDAELVQYPTRDELKNLMCYRIVNVESERKTKLVKIESNPVSPKTEIEDSLNGKLFYETLLEFKDDFPELANVLNDITDPSQESVYFALDLSPSKLKLLDNFFNAGNNKFDFAKKYVSKIGEGYEVPDWIDNIKNIY